MRFTPGFISQNIALLKCLFNLFIFSLLKPVADYALNVPLVANSSGQNSPTASMAPVTQSLQRRLVSSAGRPLVKQKIYSKLYMHLHY